MFTSEQITCPACEGRGWIDPGHVIYTREGETLRVSIPEQACLVCNTAGYTTMARLREFASPKMPDAAK